MQDTSTTQEEPDRIIRDLTVLAPTLNDLPMRADPEFRYDALSESIILGR